MFFIDMVRVTTPLVYKMITPPKWNPYKTSASNP